MYDVKYVYNVFLKYMYVSVKEMSVKVNIYIKMLLVLAFLLSLIIFWPFIQIMIRYTQNTQFCYFLCGVWLGTAPKCISQSPEVYFSIYPVSVTGHRPQVYFTITRSVFQYLSCFSHWAQPPSGAPSWTRWQKSWRRANTSQVCDSVTLMPPPSIQHFTKTAYSDSLPPHHANCHNKSSKDHTPFIILTCLLLHL